MKKKILSKKVVVGLSGGVDSSVSAYLLKKAGYNVVGAFIRTWQPTWLPCTWREERHDAMRVAAHLKIPFVTINLEKEYKKLVVQYMIDEYKAGRTPNPDVMCNKEIKFGFFLRKAMLMGADYVATGHYARKIVRGKRRMNNGKKITQKTQFTGHYSLATGLDPAKDQSYFLWTLNQKQLSKILFPVGHLKKNKVRSIARKIGLPNSEKKDSQGICFLGKVKMREFLGHYMKEKKGKVLNTQGEVVGRHLGVNFYTIGERHGFQITNQSIVQEPMFILCKNLKKNTLVVGSRNELLKMSNKNQTEYTLKNTNWIDTAPISGKVYTAQVRYHQDYQFCRVLTKRNKTIVRFSSAQNVASGQSVVIYDGHVCLGGGVIM